MKRILITEIQAYRGAHFLHFVCHGGAARTPAPPSVTPLVVPPQKFIFCGADFSSTIVSDQMFNRN